MVGCDVLAAEEAGSSFAGAVLAGERDVDCQVVVQQAARLVKPLHVDDRRHDAPETLAVACAFDKDRKAANETLAALLEIDRPGEHQRPLVARPQRGGTLGRVFSIVETDGLLVTGHGIHQ